MGFKEGKTEPIKILTSGNSNSFVSTVKNGTDVDESVRLSAVIVRWRNKWSNPALDCARFPWSQEPVWLLDQNELAEVWSGCFRLVCELRRISHSLTSVQVSVCWGIESVSQIGTDPFKSDSYNVENKNKIHKKSDTQRKREIFQELDPISLYVNAIPFSSSISINCQLEALLGMNASLWSTTQRLEPIKGLVCFLAQRTSWKTRWESGGKKRDTLSQIAFWQKISGWTQVSREKRIKILCYLTKNRYQIVLLCLRLKLKSFKWYCSNLRSAAISWAIRSIQTFLRRWDCLGGSYYVWRCFGIGVFVPHWPSIHRLTSFMMPRWCENGWTFTPDESHGFLSNNYFVKRKQEVKGGQSSHYRAFAKCFIHQFTNI